MTLDDDPGSRNRADGAAPPVRWGALGRPPGPELGGRERGQPRHRPAAGRLRTTRLSRGVAARLRHRGPPGRRGRRRPLDLERRRRAVSRRHRNRRHLPCQATSVRRGQGHLRRRDGLGRSSGPRTGVPSWTPAGSVRSSPRYAPMPRPRQRRESATTFATALRVTRRPPRWKQLIWPKARFRPYIKLEISIPTSQYAEI